MALHFVKKSLKKNGWNREPHMSDWTKEDGHELSNVPQIMGVVSKTEGRSVAGRITRELGSDGMIETYIPCTNIYRVLLVLCLQSVGTVSRSQLVTGDRPLPDPTE